MRIAVMRPIPFYLIYLLAISQSSSRPALGAAAGPRLATPPREGAPPSAPHGRAAGAPVLCPSPPLRGAGSESEVRGYL